MQVAVGQMIDCKAAEALVPFLQHADLALAALHCLHSLVLDARALQAITSSTIAEVGEPPACAVSRKAALNVARNASCLKFACSALSQHSILLQALRHCD